MNSLGLRGNPNILTYPETGEVFRLPPDWVEAGKQDWGGIWITKTLSRAKSLVRYMAKKHQISGCRIFLAKTGQIFYENDYRIKTDSVEFWAEIILD